MSLIWIKRERRRSNSIEETRKQIMYNLMHYQIYIFSRLLILLDLRPLPLISEAIHYKLKSVNFGDKPSMAVWRGSLYVKWGSHKSIGRINSR